MGGMGGGLTCYYYGFMEDLIEMEAAYNKRLVEHHKIPPQFYYTRTNEGGIASHLRYIPIFDDMDGFEEKRLAVMDEMHAWVHKTFPNIHCPMGDRDVYADSIGMGHLMEKLRETLDPNHIGYLAGARRLAPEEEKKAAATRPNCSYRPSIIPIARRYQELRPRLNPALDFESVTESLPYTPTKIGRPSPRFAGVNSYFCSLRRRRSPFLMNRYSMGGQAFQRGFPSIVRDTCPDLSFPFVLLKSDDPTTNLLDDGLIVGFGLSCRFCMRASAKQEDQDDSLMHPHCLLLHQ